MEYPIVTFYAMCFDRYLITTIKCLNLCIEIKMENQFKGMFCEINITCISSVTLMCMDLQLSTFSDFVDILQAKYGGRRHMHGRKMYVDVQ